MIQLSKDLMLPADAVTQKIAFLARSGAGKTYAAGKLVEELARAKAQVVVVDPVGVWWGIRLAANGKDPGVRDFYVFGGQHGDLPLEASGGNLVADCIVDNHISVVLDVSDFTGAEMRRFVADFATHLHQRKKTAKSPLMVVWEECQDFVPQRFSGDAARMVGAMERLIKQGRNFGIGTTLISQRPQAVNKDVLNQTECLIVGQLTGPQERKTIGGWVEENAAEVASAVAELPKLERGEMFVWSPQWLRTFKRVKIGKKWTFDASNTPTESQALRALAPVDLDALRTKMADSVERAKQEDPKALRLEIARLKKELAARPSVKPERIEVPMLSDKEKKYLGQFLDAFQRETKALDNRHDTLRGAIEGLRKKIACLDVSPGTPKEIDLSGPPRVILPPLELTMPPAPGPITYRFKTVSTRKPTDAAALPRGECAVLRALIQFPRGLRREQITVLTGYKRSSRDAYIQRLREKEFAAIVGDTVMATSAGVSALPDAEPLPIGRALQEYWITRLPKGERAMLEQLIPVYPAGVAREELSTATGYQRSSRDAYLQRLGAKELIGIVGGEVFASATLFDGAP